ncbi:MAG: hypothetical protein FD161_376 [Limisphaerales bacterium]|nr:MAG: hypothetical protein FD161_376 [Limisphaerales bacterium]KAG0510822.1 MAG: hypothetical protein E1N63_376 [Limisphaerales bacterium]TXT52718.1 MAG: hypothetical protein FD140_638 [Limisphaerales bacterium]
MRKTSLLIAGMCAWQAGARAQDLAIPAAARHHFGVGVPTWLKVHAKFTATRATNPGAAPAAPATLADGRVDRFYDDSYNRVNSVGNPVLSGEPRTSFFGYQSDAQVANAVGAGTLAMHSVQLNGGDYTRALDNQPFPGLETFYRYDWKAGKNWTASWELAAAYHFFHWERNGAPGSTVDLITDTFGLGGVALPPGAPFDGSFTPVPFGALSGSTPTRTQATVAAAVAGRRQLDFHALQFRVAPALNWEPNRNWQIGVQAGLALGVGFSQLSFAEQITVADPATPVINQSGRSSAAHLWAGLFSSLRVNRRLGEHWDAHVEVRHLLTDSIRHNGPTRSGEISLSEGVGLAAGIAYRF